MKKKAAVKVLGFFAIFATGHGDAEPAAPLPVLGSSYAVDHFTIDGGEGESVGGTFAIRGTIGQPDVDPLQPSSGGPFAITGGFWPAGSAGTPQGAQIFRNGFE